MFYISLLEVREDKVDQSVGTGGEGTVVRVERPQ